jgi:hypothetical protein
MLLQCGNERVSPVTVALLGRFLPRLGPLPQGERPFFLRFLPRLGPLPQGERPFFLTVRAGLFGGGSVRPQLFDWDLGEPIGQYFELLRQLGKRA